MVFRNNPGHILLPVLLAGLDGSAGEGDAGGDHHAQLLHHQQWVQSSPLAELLYQMLAFLTQFLIYSLRS